MAKKKKLKNHFVHHTAPNANIMSDYWSRTGYIILLTIHPIALIKI